MAWVEVDKFWTVNPANENPKDHFDPGDPIGYRVRYSMRNGDDTTTQTMVTPLGRSAIKLTDGTTVNHGFWKSNKLKKVSDFCYEGDFDWDATIPADAVAKKILPWIRLFVPERNNRLTGQFWID